MLNGGRQASVGVIQDEQCNSLSTDRRCKPKEMQDLMNVAQCHSLSARFDFVHWDGMKLLTVLLHKKSSPAIGSDLLSG